jgi:hypothetical protein
MLNTKKKKIKKIKNKINQTAQLEKRYWVQYCHKIGG